MISVRTETFSNFDEFLQWKEDFERGSLSSFVLNTSPKQRKRKVRTLEPKSTYCQVKFLWRFVTITYMSNSCHLHLPDSLRMTIAAKLNDGVTISTILDSIRDNVDKVDRGPPSLSSGHTQCWPQI